MSASTFDYGKAAFDLIAQLDAVSTTVDLARVLDRFLSHLGVENFVVAAVPLPQQAFEQSVLLRKLPLGWYEHYIAERYAWVDPVMRLCQRTTGPFEWAEAPYDPDREPRSAAVMRRAADFGMKQGLSVPIHGTNGYDACFSVSGSELDLAPNAKPAVHLVAIYAYEQSRKISSPRLICANPLTRREQEVLLWAAAGKTSSDIGEILGIAERTVTTHVVNAADKLGAHNKTQAVAMAIQRRYICL